MPTTTTTDLDTCPSGECQDYDYSGPVPRTLAVVIHTRQAFFECEHLAYLMDDPGPPAGSLAWADASALAIAGHLL